MEDPDIALSMAMDEWMPVLRALSVFSNVAIGSPETVWAMKPVKGSRTDWEFHHLMHDGRSLPRPTAATREWALGGFTDAYVRTLLIPGWQGAAMHFAEGLRRLSEGSPLLAAHHAWMGVEGFAYQQMRSELQEMGFDHESQYWDHLSPPTSRELRLAESKKKSDLRRSRRDLAKSTFRSERALCGDSALGRGLRLLADDFEHSLGRGDATTANASHIAPSSLATLRRALHRAADTEPLWDDEALLTREPMALVSGRFEPANGWLESPLHGQILESQFVQHEQGFATSVGVRGQCLRPVGALEVRIPTPVVGRQTDFTIFESTWDLWQEENSGAGDPDV